ncbi:MAG: SPOR domain-containing protein [Rhodobacteraceae bacterium]|nr:SPOR domain-containing protein [Paracoccaceae bacterium]
MTTLDAQTLRNAQPPAEFPPASYTGKQYIDSRGCIYIRAGIDGNVTWVPRVSRARKQVCGYKPTAVAGASPAKPVQKVTVISNPQPAAAKPAVAAKPAPPRPSPAPAPTRVATPRTVPAPAAPRATAPATTRVTTARPPATTRTTTARPPAASVYRPSPGPAPTVVSPQAKPSAPPIQPRRAKAPAASGGCPNASAFSQQFINKTGVRCGPQTEAPITYGKGWDRSSSLTLPSDTRVVPRHVHDKRQNTTNVSVPAGYRTVWKDGRLNPHRAERSLAPSVIQARLPVPAGYKRVERGDDRLNIHRGVKTAGGDAATDLIWTRTVPRTLAPVETHPRVVRLSGPAARSLAEARAPATIRVSSRSAPEAAGTRPAPAGAVRRR